MDMNVYGTQRNITHRLRLLKAHYDLSANDFVLGTFAGMAWNGIFPGEGATAIELVMNPEVLDSLVDQYPDLHYTGEYYRLLDEVYAKAGKWNQNDVVWSTGHQAFKIPLVKDQLVTVRDNTKLSRGFRWTYVFALERLDAFGRADS